MRTLGTIFAGLLGLAFGSFLNVCLSRWPAGESVVEPRSHCRNCDRPLTWWENLPLISWLALRGRCRTCRTWIGWRYPLVELAVGGLWAYRVWTGVHLFGAFPVCLDFVQMFNWMPRFPEAPFLALGFPIFVWLLVALAVLDGEHLWLPDKLTVPGIVVGFAYTILRNRFDYRVIVDFGPPNPPFAIGGLQCFLGILAAAALILLIRWLYWLIRRREGVGLGDAKLMALIAAWLGLPGALLAFFIGVILGACAALVLVVVPLIRNKSLRNQSEDWSAAKLPLGTFLCIGGIVSGLWGRTIISAYMRWAGL